jgi:phenylalanyl-tRNA synthetase beta subunit
LLQIKPCELSEEHAKELLQKFKETKQKAEELIREANHSFEDAKQLINPKGNFFLLSKKLTQRTKASFKRVNHSQVDFLLNNALEAAQSVKEEAEKAAKIALSLSEYLKIKTENAHVELDQAHAESDPTRRLESFSEFSKMNSLQRDITETNKIPTEAQELLEQIQTFQQQITQSQ